MTKKMILIILLLVPLVSFGAVTAGSNLTDMADGTYRANVAGSKGITLCVSTTITSGNVTVSFIFEFNGNAKKYYLNERNSSDEMVKITLKVTATANLIIPVPTPKQAKYIYFEVAESDVAVTTLDAYSYD